MTFLLRFCGVRRLRAWNSVFRLGFKPTTMMARESLSRRRPVSPLILTLPHRKPLTPLRDSLNFMKNLRPRIGWLALLFIAGCFAIGARAASVSPGGYTNSFSTLPPAADWSFLTVAGAAGDITTASALDATVQATP